MSGSANLAQSATYCAAATRANALSMFRANGASAIARGSPRNTPEMHLLGGKVKILALTAEIREQDLPNVDVAVAGRLKRDIV